ncbi:MAG: aminopeptidase [Caldilineaceae bacterium]|nr:aminopeptidase [Caldilineaceae bacterium]
MTDDEFAAAGGNQSMIHIDFMIGSAAMDVDGVTVHGTVEPIMRGGEWAFDI